MPVQSFKEREKQRREQEILTAAGSLIAECGYVALTMDDVADAVGISKPTLYQHFKSKEDLAKQVMIEAFDMLEAYLIMPQPGAPLDQLQSILRFLLEQDHAPGSVLARLGPEMVLAALRSNAELAERKARIWKRICALIEEGKAQGQIDADMPTPVVVRTMFCLLDVLPHQADQNAAVNSVIRLFFCGITAR